MDRHPSSSSGPEKATFEPLSAHGVTGLTSGKHISFPRRRPIQITELPLTFRTPDQTKPGLQPNHQTFSLLGAGSSWLCSVFVPECCSQHPIAEEGAKSLSPEHFYSQGMAKQIREPLTGSGKQGWSRGGWHCLCLTS